MNKKKKAPVAAEADDKGLNAMSYASVPNTYEVYKLVHYVVNLPSRLRVAIIRAIDAGRIVGVPPAAVTLLRSLMKGGAGNA